MNRKIDSKNLLSQKIYWLNKLTEEIPETNIFLDYIRPLNPCFKDNSVSFKLSNDLSQAIIKIARGSYFSTYWILLSTLNILLQKYTRNNDVIFGIPVYEYIDKKCSNSPFIPLRTKITPQLTFQDFLSQVKDEIISAYNNQNCNFEEIIQLLEISTTSNRSPIFDIVVLLENIHDRSNLEQLNNDITVAFSIENKVIVGKIEYKNSLFDSKTIELLSKYYINILESIIRNVEIKISEITSLKYEDRSQLLKNFNRNIKKYPVEPTIDRLFEQQVRHTPHNIAAVYQENKVTYQQLNQKANQVARLLRKLGVTRGVFVGIFKDRDLNFLIAILAIYKAGGAYVPIDSTYPLKRITHMLSNSEVKYLLTDFSLLNTLEEVVPNCQQLSSVICLDNVISDPQLLGDRIGVVIYQKSDYGHFSDHNLELVNDSVCPAYMLYTSGSTGLPKGAIVRHNGAINHIYAQFDRLGLGEEFTFLQSAPSSTDISVWQFLAPLLIGGKTIVVDLETVALAEKLFNVLKSEKITVVELVPALFRGLLKYTSQLSIHERELLDLQWMILSGESTSIKPINEWLNIYPQVKIANAYGPTEAADDITQFIVDEPVCETRRTIPIGKPLANLNLYVLDESMQLLPIGAPGEICVSGIGVGDGYWKNEEKTKQAFVDNPFINQLLSPHNHEVIYKTGDLGRWLPDGNIEFLGRIDHQVKIRGFRVEIGEIETCLSQHSNVSENVVVVHQEETGNVQLVAYVVAKIEPVPSARELRNFLKEKLPDHMIPSVFMMVTSIPLAPSGKVDRKALPVLDLAIQKSSYTAPRNPKEEILANIWQEVLNLPKVGVNDNFFELGGHSLLAIRVISRVKQVFEIELPLRSLFEKPTVTNLAKYIQTSLNPSLQQKIEPVSRTEAKFPLSFAQQRLWFLVQLEPNSPDYNLPAVLNIQGKLDIATLEQSFNEIIRRHEVLRTNFVELDGEPVQVITSTLKINLEAIELADKSKIQELIRKEALKAFNLTNAPLFKIKLFRIEPEEYILVFVVHHIISDLWSAGLILQELNALYKSAFSEKPFTLPDLLIQYVDFAVWQREYLQNELLDNHLQYWQQQLQGNLPVLNFSSIISQTASISNSSATCNFAFDKNFSNEIQAFSQRESATVFITFLTVFKVLLSICTEQEDIIVGSPISNRDRLELELLIGLFVNTLLLRTNLSGNPTFRELLSRVREITLNGYAHRALPFEKLVEVLQPNRKQKQLPFLQVWFTLNHGLEKELKLTDLVINQIKFDTEISKYELRLDLTETTAGLQGSFGYRTNLFEPETISFMVDSLKTILRQVITDPDLSLTELTEIIIQAKQKYKTDREKTLAEASLGKLKKTKRKIIK